MAEAVITEKEAYLAMFEFLYNHWSRCQSDDLAALLGSLAVAPDGGPMDPAFSQDWKSAVAKAQRGEVNASIGLR